MYELNKNIDIENKEIDVLAIGELLVDMISEDYNGLNSPRYSRYFGGSPGNLSINLSKIGNKSAIITNLGSDNLGKFLKETLEINKVNCDGVSIDEDSSTSMVLVGKSKDSPEFIAYRDSDKNIKLTDKLVDMAQKSKILHFTAWPISHNPSRSTVLELIKIGREYKAIIGFDPNYREILWEKGHDGRSFIEGLIANIDIIKPSEDDAKELFGKGTPIYYVDRFIELGARLVILTLGKDGLIVSNGKETVQIPSLAKDVVDTTGAGDAFWSGLYTGLLRSKTINDSIKLGNMVAAYKLKEVGALANLPKYEELEKLINI